MRGEGDALAALYDRLAPLAYGLALRISGDPDAAEEAVQEAFVRVWRRLERHPAGRVEPRPWFCQLVRRAAIDRRRMRLARGLGDEFGSEPGPAAPTGTASPAAFVAGREALGALSAAERRVLENAYLDDLSASEIAARDGSSVVAVLTRLRAGAARLRADAAREGRDGA